MNEDAITVSIRPVEGSMTIGGVADVTLALEVGEVTLRGFRVIHKDQQNPWVAFPQESYMKGGEKKYVPIIEASRRFKNLIERKVLDAYGKDC